MADNPKASVIINNYNYGRFLADAIDSALGQTYDNTEVIVVDDGSTDGSREVIHKHEKQILPVFKENGGQGSAYNAGFQASCGDVICFLDADDMLLPDAMKNAVALMADARVHKVQWPLRVVDRAGAWRGELSTRRPPPQGDLFQQVVATGPIYDFEFTTGAAYRRSMLQAVLPMPEEPYWLGGDEYLMAVVPVFGTVRTTDDALGVYRAHGCNNYRDQPYDDHRLRQYMHRFEANCDALKDVLAKRGLHADIERWKERNFNYVWPQRLLLAKSDMETLIPAGASYALVNNNEWGSDPHLDGRRAFPFLERDGEYWGPPPNDEVAITELCRLRTKNGIAYIVFWWTAFWWLEEYARFFDWLRSNHRCILENERLLAFQLREIDKPRTC